jgi:hypothetical protein
MFAFFRPSFTPCNHRFSSTFFTVNHNTGIVRKCLNKKGTSYRHFAEYRPAAMPVPVSSLPRPLLAQSEVKFIQVVSCLHGITVYKFPDIFVKWQSNNQHKAR